MLGHKQLYGLQDAQNQLFVDFGLVQAQLRTAACARHCLGQLEESREQRDPQEAVQELGLFDSQRRG